MGIIVRGINPSPRLREAPPTFPGNPPPSKWKLPPLEKGVYRPPGGWDYDELNRQNPMMTLTAAEILSHTSTSKDQEDEDDAKKRARVAAIKAANKAKRKSWKSKVNATGTVIPTLNSYPSGTVDTAGTGFSFSDIPSVVWIILAVGIGVFAIKSAGKGKR